MDVKLLVDRLKGKGLDIAEDAAKVIVKEVIAWAAVELAKSENKIDDLLIPMLPKIEAEVMKQIDKLDGAVG